MCLLLRSHGTWCSMLLVLLVSLVLGAPGCKDRSVGVGGDGGQSDAARLDAGMDAGRDAGVDPDATSPCVAERLEMGFVVATAVEPTHPLPSVDDYQLAGTAAYHGPITVPIATNPAFHWEVQIAHGDGSISTLQYYLPSGLFLPVAEGNPYQVLFRRRQGFEGESIGVIIERPTSGLPPLLFVADVGSHGRAFEPEDLAMSPLKVSVEDWPGCPPVVDPDCGGDRILDQLRFDSSTGAATVAINVPQGGSESLPVFGDPFQVVTLASSHADPPCLGFDPWDIAYLAVSEAAMPLFCDESLFHVWNDPADLELGLYCDSIVFCVGNASEQQAAEQAAPSVACGGSDPLCGSNGILCTWNPNEPIDAALFEEICAVSVLPDPPALIQCQVFYM